MACDVVIGVHADANILQGMLSSHATLPHAAGQQHFTVRMCRSNLVGWLHAPMLHLFLCRSSKQPAAGGAAAGAATAEGGSSTDGSYVCEGVS